MRVRLRVTFYKAAFLLSLSFPYRTHCLHDKGLATDFNPPLTPVEGSVAGAAPQRSRSAQVVSFGSYSPLRLAAAGPWVMGSRATGLEGRSCGTWPSRSLCWARLRCSCAQPQREGHGCEGGRLGGLRARPERGGALPAARAAPAPGAAPAAAVPAAAEPAAPAVPARPRAAPAAPPRTSRRPPAGRPGVSGAGCVGARPRPPEPSCRSPGSCSPPPGRGAWCAGQRR